MAKGDRLDQFILKFRPFFLEMKQLFKESFYDKIDKYVIG